MIQNIELTNVMVGISKPIARRFRAEATTGIRSGQQRGSTKVIVRPTTIILKTSQIPTKILAQIRIFADFSPRSPLNIIPRTARTMPMMRTYSMLETIAPQEAVTWLVSRPKSGYSQEECQQEQHRQ